MDVTEGLLLLSRRIVPGGPEGPDEERAFRTITGNALAAAGPGVARAVAWFVRLARWLPVLRWGRRYERLSPERQDAVLGWLQAAPLAPLRKGFWGVRTLVLMGHYGRDAAARSVGWEPSRRGNDLLRAAR